MKLPDFNNNPVFNKLLLDMRAEIIPIALTPKPQEIPYKTLIALTTTGINTELKNIDFESKSHITYKKIRVIAYHPHKNIYHIFKYFMNSSFHITNCSYLKLEKKTNPQSTYLIYAGSQKISYVTVCNDCLSILNWKNYNNLNISQKKEIIEKFNIKEFIESN